MTHEHGHGHETTGHAHEPAGDGGLTGFAIVKYGFILVITIVVLWFISRFFLGG